MFLVMGITGKVGGATAEHLLAHGKEVRALVRNREKASSWANQGVELVDGDWNDSAAIERALKGVEGAFVMLPAVWAPSPDYKEAKGVIANYVEALTKAAPPRVVALSSMGANRTSGLGMITALSLLEQGFRDLASPIAFVRAGGFFENFLYGLHVAQGGTLPVYYNPTNRKSTMVATNDIGAEVATLLTGPAWSGQRVVELGSMVSADEVAAQLGEVMQRDVKAFAVPRAGWPAAFEQFGIPKGQTGPAEAMFEAVNAGWMDLGVAGTEHVAGTTPPRDVFAAARQAVTREPHRTHQKRSRSNMKILVLGATGGTGQLIVRDAAQSGHSVVALVRAKARADLPGAELIEGDARDEATLVRALDGCDAVVSALGTGMGFRQVDLLTVATRALVAAMTRTGVRR